MQIAYVGISFSSEFARKMALALCLLLGLVCANLAAPVDLAPGAWSKDASSDISTTFEYKSVGNVVQFEIVRTSTLNKTSTLPTVLTVREASLSTH